MRVVIYGLGKALNACILHMAKYFRDKVDIVYICDANVSLHGKCIWNVPIISPDDLPRKITSDNIEACLITVGVTHRDDVINKLRSMNLSVDIYVFFEEVAMRYSVINDDNVKKMFMRLPNKAQLSYVECDIVSHCNLNCNGCTHLSNILPPNYISLTDFSKDIRRLADLYAYIAKIRILGGEPLLHPQLADFIRVTRSNFPHSDIRVVTNGLKLPNVSGELFVVMRELNITFDISLYLPTFRMWHNIKSVLMNESISYHLGEPINRFFHCFSLQKRDYKEAFAHCTTHCHTLKKGHISVCGYEERLHYLSDKFDIKEWNLPDYPASLVNIHDSNIDGWKINELMNKPFLTCAYCNAGDWRRNFWQNDDLSIAWKSNSEVNINDWIC